MNSRKEIADNAQAAEISHGIGPAKTLSMGARAHTSMDVIFLIIT